MSKKMYNVHEAAHWLGIGPEQVRRLIRAGDLVAVRTKKLEEKPSGAVRGGKFLTTEEWMQQYVDSLEVA